MGANDIQHGGSHYKGSFFQHWDMMARHRIGYLEGCATKYVSRWRKKAGSLDLDKAEHYLDKIIEMALNEGYRPVSTVPFSELDHFFSSNSISDWDEQQFIRVLCTWIEPFQLEQARPHIKNLKLKAQTLGL